MRILNLYAGIGGNRKAWGNEHEVVAVEYDEKIAEIYKQNFPNDTVVVADAHEYLQEHFREFDFIWSSPPCPTHSRVRKQLSIKKKKDGTTYEQNKPIFPDMTLYEEIIFLDNYFDGFYVVENVVPYYEPLIEPQKLGRHLFWSNINLPKIKVTPRGNFDNTEKLAEILGYDTTNWTGVNKKLLLRNCVENDVSEHIFKCLLEQMNESEEKENIMIEERPKIYDILDEISDITHSNYYSDNDMENSMERALEELLSHYKELKEENRKLKEEKELEIDPYLEYGVNENDFH